MTSIEQAARTHAQEWNNHAEDQFNRGVESATGVDEDSFAAGASWLAEYLLSDESVRTAADLVAGVHHWHGDTCLCGVKSGTARQRTEHIIDMTLTTLAESGTLEPGDR